MGLIIRRQGVGCAVQEEAIFAEALAVVLEIDEDAVELPVALKLPDHVRNHRVGE